MDTRHLEEHFHELTEHMESAGYSAHHIRTFRTEFNWIVRHSDGNQWESYQDIYLERSARLRPQTLRAVRCALAALERFDLHGELPSGVKQPTSVNQRSAYSKLSPQYREVIDRYRSCEEKRGKKGSTISHEASNASCFLLAMQQRGCNELSEIGEEDAISFFWSDGALVRGCSYRKNVSAVLKAAAGGDPECARVESCLPRLREKRKNIQYLTGEEVAELKAFLADRGSGLSLRDRAIGLLLLHTGLRSCDVAAMRIDSIDWANDRISLCQQKTEAPLVLPLTPVVGNAIYDYLASERPASDEPWLFLSEAKSHAKMKSVSIGNVVTKIFRLSGIRQEKGDRKGTHIFRHKAASAMLGAGVSRPVISSVLGQTDPGSLDPYLSADFPHLKLCALSVERFPVPEEVFSLW